MRKFDPISRPAHYTFSKVEVIEAIEAWDLDYIRGNVVKYIARAGRKVEADELQDLLKCQWYLSRAIRNLERARKGSGK